MSLITKNAIPQSDFDEIQKIFIPLVEAQRRVNEEWNKRSNHLPVVMNDWENNISRELLEKYLKGFEPVDIARRRNLLPDRGVVWKEFYQANYLKQKPEYDKVRDILIKTYGTPLIGSNRGMWYNPTNYMGWHTNCGTPGKRIYVVWSTGVKSSFFRYYDKKNDEIIDDYDDKGLTIREFDVKSDELLWHAVGCIKNNRFSLGFKKEDEDSRNDG
jgi:hypothetical protein